MGTLSIPTKDWAIWYHRAGWHPLPLPAGSKYPPPEGRTGFGGADMTLEEVEVADWSGNLGVRMPFDVIGLDIDAYHGGLDTFKDLIARHGPLPDTWISHSGRNDGSGIRFYRVPSGMTWVTGLPGMEIIQRSHRYSCVHPSTHPNGRQYGWWDQAEQAPTDAVPRVEDLPDLPWKWVDELSRAYPADVGQSTTAADRQDLADFLAAHHDAEAPSYSSVILDWFRSRRQAGYSRHDTTQHCLIWAMEMARAGVVNAQASVQILGEEWVSVVSPDARRMKLQDPSRVTEFEAMLRHAVGKVKAKPQAAIDKIHDDTVGIHMNVNTPTLKAEEEVLDIEQPSGFFINWKEFANRDPDNRKWLVEGFWPWGRAMALYADAKQGKSELVLWCAAKLASGEDPWTDASIPPIDIAYFDFEMTEDDLDDRLSEMDFDLERLEHLHYALLPPLHALDTETGGGEILHLAQSVNAQALIIDTLGRAVEGEEDKADTFRRFYAHTGVRLKQSGIAYLRIDHAGKDPAKEQRGSSAKRDDVDVVWRLRRDPKVIGAVVLDCSNRSRLSWVGPQLRLDRRIDPSGLISYRTPVRMGGWSAQAIAKAAELDQAGCPLDAGRPAAIAALKAAGLRPGNNAVLSEALKCRKVLKPTSQTVPGQLPPDDLSPTPGDSEGTTNIFEPSDQDFHGGDS